jgi:hypothetical protein
VEIYRAADETRRVAVDAVHYGLGFVIGVNLPAVLPAGGLAYGGLRLGGLSDEELIAHLEVNPELLETLVGGGGGLLDGMTANPLTGPLMGALGLDGFHADTGAAADDLGSLLFGDYEGDLDHSYPLDTFDYDAPRDLGDLIDDLSQPAGDTVPNGVISVQQLTDVDGNVSYVVQLPGTDDFLAEDEIRNMGSNLNLIAGDDTAYGDAIAQAMAQAGIGPEAPVMLVGHSQGGMQAAGLAADPDFGYHVTHVVTAGSPVATTGIPDDVTVLSLENTGDVVPLLDGEPNPDAAHHVTVQSDVHGGSFGAEPGQNHSLSVYGDIADAADAGSHPSVAAVVGSMQDHGFLATEGEQVQSVTLAFQTRLGEQVRPAEIRDPLAMAGNLLP